MPINLRYDLRLRSERTLAARLDAAWQQIDRMGEAAVKPSWWDAFHANRMRRSFIRHRSMYRLKARLWVAWTHAAALLEAGEGALVFLPFYVLLRLIVGKPFPRPREALGEYQAFLLKCEIEDLQDEIQRRIDKRKGRWSRRVGDAQRADTIHSCSRP
jgi:hypothetical protein